MRLPISLRQLARRRRHGLGLPFGGARRLRVAQLTAGPLLDFALLFPSHHWSRLTAFAPQVLAGSTADLHRFASQAQLGIRDLPGVDHGVVVLTECGTYPATDDFRDLVWELFGVPVYELFLDLEGKLIASECEAHDGWHIESMATAFYLFNGELILDRRIDAVRTGLTGYVETALCPCGRSDPRLIAHGPVRRTHRSAPAPERTTAPSPQPLPVRVA
jgi:hypothetical protein